MEAVVGVGQVLDVAQTPLDHVLGMDDVGHNVGTGGVVTHIGYHSVCSRILLNSLKKCDLI